MGDDANERGEPVELFGTLELVLSEGNTTGYKDVFFLKNRKKKPYQAKSKIWRPETKDHINLGTFRKAHEAAIAVAQYRRDGREDQSSPDKSRAEKSTRFPPRPARPGHKSLLQLTCCTTFGFTEKQKLVALTTNDALVPPTFQGYENAPIQVPIAQLQAWSASSSAHAFATGAVAVALPAQPRAAPASLAMRPLSLLADDGRLMGR